MEKFIVTEENGRKLAVVLKEMYYESVIEENYTDDSEILIVITEVVDIYLQKQKELQLSSSSSFIIIHTNELAEAFLKRITVIVSKCEKFAYAVNTKFGYTIDLANVICPFVLYQMGVTDEGISFYIGLGMTIANIVCDSLANAEKVRLEKIEDMEIEDIKRTCIEMKNYIASNTSNNKLPEIENAQRALDHTISLIDASAEKKE